MRMRLTALLAALLTACPGPQAEPDDAGDPSGTTGEPAETGAETGDECRGELGCYACEPASPAQLLNACSDATCQPFDNATRLPLLVDGQIPPLP